MVGDGVKPEGLMMVEGVAASAESVVRQILGGADGSSRKTLRSRIGRSQSWAKVLTQEV
jgi:hypothetical protein